MLEKTVRIRAIAIGTLLSAGCTSQDNASAPRGGNPDEQEQGGGAGTGTGTGAGAGAGAGAGGGQAPDPLPIVFGGEGDQAILDLKLIANAEWLVAGETNADAFIGRFGTSGPTFSASFGGDSSQTARHVVQDEEGNYYVAGSYEPSIEFSPGELGEENPNDQMVFIAKMSPNGTMQWHREFGAIDGYVKSLDMNSQGDLLLSYTEHDGCHTGSRDADAVFRVMTPDGKTTYKHKVGLETECIGDLALEWIDQRSAGARWVSSSSFAMLVLEGSAPAVSIVTPDTEVIAHHELGDTVVPYGITATENAFFVSAHSSDESTNSVLVYDSSGAYLRTVDLPGRASAIAADAEGNLFAAIGPSVPWYIYWLADEDGEVESAVMAWDATGKQIWKREFSGVVATSSLVPLKDGSVAVAGAAFGLVDLGSGAVQADGVDMFLTVISPE